MSAMLMDDNNTYDEDDEEEVDEDEEDDDVIDADEFDDADDECPVSGSIFYNAIRMSKANRKDMNNNKRCKQNQKQKHQNNIDGIDSNNASVMDELCQNFHLHLNTTPSTTTLANSIDSVVDNYCHQVTNTNTTNSGGSHLTDTDTLVDSTNDSIDSVAINANRISNTAGKSLLKNISDTSKTILNRQNKPEPITLTNINKNNRKKNSNKSKKKSAKLLANETDQINRPKRRKK